MRKRAVSATSAQALDAATAKRSRSTSTAEGAARKKELDKLLASPELLPSLDRLNNAKISIGYPCINWSLGLTTSHTFRLGSHSRERVLEAVGQNLTDLEAMLDFNVQNRIHFLRIGSGIVPFASHSEVGSRVDWQSEFKARLQAIGAKAKTGRIRISMHPDQFVLLNSPKPEVHQRSVAELDYHCQLLDTMGLDNTAKVQIHVGGMYGDKVSALQVFEQRYRELSERIRRRLVIENDDRLFSLRDCLQLHKAVGVPVLFDNLHHDCLNNGEPMRDAVLAAAATWKPADGRPMLDYSTQDPGARKGKHASSINLKHFGDFLRTIRGCQADIMLEIKDKELSALRALHLFAAQQQEQKIEEDAADSS